MTTRVLRFVPRTGESESETAALERAAKFLLDVARHGPLGAVVPGEPALFKRLRERAAEAYHESDSVLVLKLSRTARWRETVRACRSCRHAPFPAD